MTAIEAIKKAEQKYMYLQEENCFLETEKIYGHEDKCLINIYWYKYMDKFINMRRVRQIANYLHKLVPAAYIVTPVGMVEFDIN